MLAGMAVAIVVILMIAAIIQMLQGNHLNMTSKITRVSLMNEWRDSSGSLLALRASLTKPENAEFLQCVCGGAGQCESGQFKPFALYGPTELPPKPFTRHFDVHGSPCDPTTSPNCLFEMETRFVAQCLPVLPSPDPTPPIRCSTPAEFVGVTVALRRGPATSMPGETFAPLTITSFTLVSKINPPGSGICP